VKRTVPAGCRELGDGTQLATRVLRTLNRDVLVDDVRQAIGQECEGHVRPLAAYDACTDRSLVLDVSRYKSLTMADPTPLLCRKAGVADRHDVAVVGAATAAEHRQVPQPPPQLMVTAAKVHRIAWVELYRLIQLSMALL
jgi:hypothetical protein